MPTKMQPTRYPGAGNFPQDKDGCLLRIPTGARTLEDESLMIWGIEDDPPE